MALLDFLRKAQEKVDSLQKKAETITTQIEKDPIKALSEMMNTSTKQVKSCKPNLMAKEIISMFYSDYPEKPYISDDRKADWIEMATLFPKTAVVQRTMMQRYADGLLPGHVYMLYWLKKYTSKKVPAYFEYKYGIDFEKELAFLHDKGFLDNMNKPTTKGEKAIEKHSKVIDNHTPAKPDLSIEGISAQIIKQRDSIMRNGFKHYTFIANKDCCDICAAINGKHFPISSFEIGVNAPPMHDRCKCSIAAYEDSKDYESWLDYLDKGGTTKQFEAAKKKKR